MVPAVKLKLLGSPMLKPWIQIICALAATLLATHLYSQVLSSWSDKTICRLVSTEQKKPQFLQEAKKRELNCVKHIVIKTTVPAGY